MVVAAVMPRFPGGGFEAGFRGTTLRTIAATFNGSLSSLGRMCPASSDVPAGSSMNLFFFEPGLRIDSSAAAEVSVTHTISSRSIRPTALRAKWTRARSKSARSMTSSGTTSASPQRPESFMTRRISGRHAEDGASNGPNTEAGVTVDQAYPAAGHIIANSTHLIWGAACAPIRARSGRRTASRSYKTMMALLLAILVQGDHAVEVMKRVTLPSPESVTGWEGKGPEYKQLLEILLKRENWITAIRQCEDRVGAFSIAWEIEVKLGEWDGTHVASGDRVGDKGQIRFNLRKLGDYERKMDGYRQQAEELKKKGKTMYWKVPPIRYERIIHHELVHVLQGEYKSPGWFHEGLASWVGDDANYIAAFAHAKKPVQSIEVDLSADPDDEYARGHVFFKWLEDRNGKDGVKRLFTMTAIDGGDWKKSLEEVTGLEWAKIVAVEGEWSEGCVKKKRPKE